jgi:hypothetical protein
MLAPNSSKQRTGRLVQFIAKIIGGTRHHWFSVTCPKNKVKSLYLLAASSTCTLEQQQNIITHLPTNNPRLDSAASEHMTNNPACVTNLKLAAASTSGKLIKFEGDILFSPELGYTSGKPKSTVSMLPLWSWLPTPGGSVST